MSTLPTHMQERIYIAKPKKILAQTIYIWVFVGGQIWANIAFSTGIPGNRFLAFLAINIMLGLFTVPSILLFISYYKHSIGKKFIVNYDSLKLIDEKTGMTTEIQGSEIDKIVLYENLPNSYLPWASHEYFAITDTKQNKIIVTSYIMRIHELWSGGMDDDIITRKEKFYPII